MGTNSDYSALHFTLHRCLAIASCFKKMKTRLSFYIRSASQSALQITALALGLSLITVLSILRTDLLERWQQQLPEGTPNQFVYTYHHLI